MGRATQGDGVASELRGSTAPMGHADWMQAAAEEYRRLLDLLGHLEAAQWAAPTDCEGWAVRDVVAHLVGAGEATASIRETLRQGRAGKALLPDADPVDGMNEVQVRERADHSPAQLLEALADVAPRSVRARTRLPRLLRALPVPLGPPLGTKPIGYLMDRIYTRDAWLHRIDICRAVARPPVLSADHDGRIIGDVVAEWADLHGKPVELVLTGPAGGRWARGTGGEHLEVDAVEYCRILSGRATGTGLLATRVNF